VPFTGAPVAIRATALATSSAAIGWMSADGRVYFVAIGREIRDALDEFEELRRADY